MQSWFKKSVTTQNNRKHKECAKAKFRCMCFLNDHLNYNQRLYSKAKRLRMRLSDCGFTPKKEEIKYCGTRCCNEGYKATNC